MKHFLSALLLLAVSMSAIAQEHRFHPRFDATNPDVHDPVMAYCDGRYYIFATGFGISCMSSADLNEWRMERPVFTDAPQWARDAVKGYRGHTWAPDIQYHNGLWYLFYSCSAFGKNTSAIGVMVNKTLNPESPLYQWIDRGKVVQSYPGKTNWNAIDPNMIVDERGREWIVWGSFWDGIQLARLKKGVVKSNPKTIARRYHLTSKQQPTEADIALANEAPDAGVNAIEAPFIIHEGDYYYLFASWDYCCKGPCSNYKTVVGRSKDVRGPYLDRNGIDMANGGGELIAGPDEEYYGIGHCGLMKHDGTWHIVAHGYSKAHNGASKLWHRTLTFTPDGWPQVEAKNL